MFPCENTHCWHYGEWFYKNGVLSYNNPVHLPKSIEKQQKKSVGRYLTVSSIFICPLCKHFKKKEFFYDPFPDSA